MHSKIGIKLEWSPIIDFLCFRLARIYPLHIAILILFVISIECTALLTNVRPNEPFRFSALAALQHILLLHGWGVSKYLTWNFPSWSISSEWAAYLAAPGIFFLAVRLRGLTLYAFLAAAGGLLAVWLEQGSPSLRMALPRVLLGFLLGTLICRLRDQHAADLTRFRAPSLVAFWLAYKALLFTHYSGAFVLAFCGVMLLHGLPGIERKPNISMRVLTYAGDTSFAVYMGHAFIMNIWLTLSRKLHIMNHGNVVLLAFLLIVLGSGLIAAART